jgi:hypothetical protein
LRLNKNNVIPPPTTIPPNKGPNHAQMKEDYVTFSDFCVVGEGVVVAVVVVVVVVVLSSVVGNVVVGSIVVVVVGSVVGGVDFTNQMNKKTMVK